MKRFVWLVPFVLLACSHKGADVKKDGRTEAQKAFGAVAGKTDDTKVEVKKTAEAASSKAESASDATAPAGAVTLSCKSGKDERTLVTAAKDKGCEVTYTKQGQSKAVGNGLAGFGVCEKIANKIKSNLEKQGFTCH